MHTEVIWLSKGIYLERFLAVSNSVIFSEKDSIFADNLVKTKIGIAYV